MTERECSARGVEPPNSKSVSDRPCDPPSAATGVTVATRSAVGCDARGAATKARSDPLGIPATSRFAGEAELPNSTSALWLPSCSAADFASHAMGRYEVPRGLPSAAKGVTEAPAISCDGEGIGSLPGRGIPAVPKVELFAARPEPFASTTALGVAPGSPHRTSARAGGSSVSTCSGLCPGAVLPSDATAWLVPSRMPCTSRGSAAGAMCVSWASMDTSWPEGAPPPMTGRMSRAASFDEGASAVRVRDKAKASGSGAPWSIAALRARESPAISPS